MGLHLKVRVSSLIISCTMPSSGNVPLYFIIRASSPSMPCTFTTMAGNIRKQTKKHIINSMMVMFMI